MVILGGYIGIMEKNMETTMFRVSWFGPGPIGIEA